MTVQAWKTRRLTGRYGRVLTACLALAILVPLGVLFFAHHGYQREGRSLAAQERQGVEYLRALGQLTIALTDAQTAAVNGEELPREALDRSVADVADVDERYGDELLVRERWSLLRNTIERVAGTDHADGRAAYTPYEEATGMLLDLHDRLRNTTGLVRDPQQDAYHLQDAMGGALPKVVVAVGRLADLVTIAASEPARERAANATEVSAAEAAVTGPADDLVVGIQAMLDTTESHRLSSTVLSKYDRFLRAKDGLLGLVPADGNAEEVDLGLLAGIRTELQAAADDLSTTLLAELDTLIETRASEFGRGQWTAIASMSVGVLLALGLAAISLVGDTRQPAHRPYQDELGGGDGGDDGRGGGTGAGHGTPELSSFQKSISDSAAGYGHRSGVPSANDRLAGEVLGSERANVR